VLRRSPLILIPSVALALACATDDTVAATDTSATGTSGTSTGTGQPGDLPGETSVGEGESGTDESGIDESGTDESGTETSVEPGCGNGIIDDGEQCDGDDLAGLDCTDLGYAGGELACDPVVCVFDASACEPGPGNDDDGATIGTTG
jgi:hypothetical protein